MTTENSQHIVGFMTGEMDRMMFVFEILNDRTESRWTFRTFAVPFVFWVDVVAKVHTRWTRPAHDYFVWFHHTCPVFDQQVRFTDCRLWVSD